MPSTLTVERLREVLDYDPETGVFTSRRLGRAVGCKSKHLGYWIVSVTGHGQFYAHRLAWFYTHGEWPQFIDHINGDKLDNRLVNLRNVERRINNQNRRTPNPNNTAGFLGVSFVPTNASPWVARVCVGKKSVYIKACKTPEEAHAAYVEAKRRLHRGCTI